MSSDDRELLERISSGDESALRDFYMRHEGPVFRFINSIMNDPVEATDILNEVMFEVWRGAHRFEGRSKASTWMFGIARNKTYDRLRKRRPESHVELDPEMRDDDNPGPEAYMEASENAVFLRECMEGLSTSHREAVHLAFFEDLSYPEIATLVDCPAGTVKTRMFHAKRLLQNCLEHMLGNQP